MTVPTWRRPLRVLAIEDDAVLGGLYGAWLHHEGHEVHLVGNGLDGLRELSWDPDLILLDLMMPVMDGYEFLEHVGRSAEFADVPVVVLTGALLRGQTTLHGAQAVLRKPFQLHRLLSVVENYSHQLTERLRPN